MAKHSFLVQSLEIAKSANEGKMGRNGRILMQVTRVQLPKLHAKHLRLVHSNLPLFFYFVYEGVVWIVPHHLEPNFKGEWGSITKFEDRYSGGILFAEWET
jgi:hypothetical protein